MKRLQTFDPSVSSSGRGCTAASSKDLETYRNAVDAACAEAEELLDEMLTSTVEGSGDFCFEICGGIPSRMKPFRDWLSAIRDSIAVLHDEAKALEAFVDTVAPGIDIGYGLLKRVNWSVPDRSDLERAITAHIRNDSLGGVPGVSSVAIAAALQKLASKDERTLRQLVVQGSADLDVARKLLERSAVLLERELRRQALDREIVKLSEGGPIQSSAMKKGMWYWADTGNGCWRVVCFEGKANEDCEKATFVDVDSSLPTKCSVKSVQVKEYIPVAEALSRAQKAFLTCELHYGKKFKYNAFMEFGNRGDRDSLRCRLRRLAVVSQIHCSELDKARVNVLVGVMQSYSGGNPKCPPQNVTIIGGGPTGLLCGIHAVQNVLFSGGRIKIYEKYSAYETHGGTFERAQIVRLDARQISMLRYYLGTGYEDIFVPAQGETDPHLGNVM